MHSNKPTYWSINLALLLMIIATSLLPNLASFSQYTILFELTFIFYFSVNFPRALPLWALLLYGLFNDMLAINTFGYHALLFTSFRTAIDWQELDPEETPPVSMWLRFGLTLLGILALQACMVSIFLRYNFWQLLKNCFFSWLLTIAVYPACDYIYGRCLQLTSIRRHEL